MSFDELKEIIKSCGFESIRAEKPEYLETVTLKQHAPALAENLAKFFGAPAWPSDGKLTNEVHALIESHGGIMKGQVLYFAHLEGFAVFVMLWPWSDGQHTTVKVGKK